jgi:phosphomevalonate kinase
MAYTSYRVKVPGKLLIAGEYAVLEPNQQAIVVAVDRFITAYIEPSIQNQLSIPKYGLEPITWDMGNKFIHSDQRLRFIQNSINVVNQYLQEKSVTLRPFHLTIKSELDDHATGKKYGLGSSAAVVVAVISAILTLHNEGKIEPQLTHIFKLAAIAHLKTQKSGSGVDIAASTFGGWLAYSSFNPQWVGNELSRRKSLCKLVEKPWPNLSITALNPPPKLKLSVGWTKESARTAPMISKVKKYREQNQDSYTRFLEKSSFAVNQMIKSFEKKDCDAAILSLTQNRKALQILNEEAEITIETEKLESLCNCAEKFGSGKSSGAGGGDCGIAFTTGDEQLEELHKAWQKEGIVPLRLSVSKLGVFVTEYNCEMPLVDYVMSV